MLVATAGTTAGKIEKDTIETSQHLRYTAARARLLAKKQAEDDARLAERAGMSHDAVTKATSLSWSQWVTELDARWAEAARRIGTTAMRLP